MIIPWWITTPASVAAGFVLYDQIYKRARTWQADAIRLREMKAKAGLTIQPTNGQLGGIWDGQQFRNLDDHTVLGMNGEPTYFDEIAFRLNRTERMLLASAQGRRIPQNLIEQLEAEIPQVELGSTTIGDLVKKYAFKPSLRNVLIGEQVDEVTNQVVPLTLDIPSSVHILCTGASGLGKSTLLESIAMQLAMSDGIWLAAIDYGSGTFDRLEDYLHWSLAGDDLAVALIHELVGLCKKRKEKYEKVGRVRSLQQYNAHTGENVPFVVLIVDETPPLMENPQAKSATTELLQMGRKYGVGVVVAGTDFKVDTLPSQARGNCQARIAFWLEPGLSRSVFNSNAATELESVGDIYVRKPGHPGLIRGHTPDVIDADYRTLGLDQQQATTEQVVLESKQEIIDNPDLSKEERVVRLKEAGHSDTAIAREVYGYGNSFYIGKVREVLADVVVVDDTEND